MQRLLPDPGPTSPAEQLDTVDFRALAPPERPYVVSNFVVTVDGRATISGRSGPIGSGVDTQMLMELRAGVDAVMIGAGTMRAERYGRMVPSAELRERRERRGLARDPLAVIVSGRMDLPWEADLFASGAGQVLIATSTERRPPPTATPTSVLGHAGPVDLAWALAHMRRELGVRSLLLEGGPHLHSEMLASELVDEMFVTCAPKLAGGDALRMVEGMPERARELELAWLLAEGNELFARYRLLRAP